MYTRVYERYERKTEEKGGEAASDSDYELSVWGCESASRMPQISGPLPPYNLDAYKIHSTKLFPTKGNNKNNKNNNKKNGAKDLRIVRF